MRDDNNDWPMPNHNTTWTNSMILSLHTMWEGGVALRDCARDLGRTELAIACKLASTKPRGSDHIDSNNRSTWINPNTATVTTVSSHVLDANNYCTASNIPTTTQEHKMNKFTVIANFEESISKVLESLTLNDFVTEIAAKEAEIKTLKSLKNKPNAVVDKIEQLKHDIDILIIQCDTLIK